MSVTLKDLSQKSIPAIDLDRLHICSFTMQQKHPRNLTITAVGKRYGVDAAGDHVFDSEVMEAHTENADLDIATYSCQKRQITPEQFQADYAAALGEIDASYKAGLITEAQIMAYMELGMALIFEVKDKIAISGTAG